MTYSVKFQTKNGKFSKASNFDSLVGAELFAEINARGRIAFIFEPNTGITFKKVEP